jgi:LPS-assembly lipoprotein
MFKKPAHYPATAYFLLALALLSISACGFQPRGQAMGLAGVPNPVHISGIASFSDLYRELYRQLKIAGAQIAPTGAESASTLHITGVEQDIRLLSVNSRNRAVEYELIAAATFSLRTANGQELVAPQQVRVLRIQYRPEIAVLGSGREAELLRQNMREELAGRIVRRLTAQRKAAE